MTSPTSARSNRAFTLTEMLIVIGIMLMLIAILLPATLRAVRAGERARQSADLQAISVGLEQFKSDHKDYPRAATPGSNAASYGTALLARYLIAPQDAGVDGVDGPGFRTGILTQGTKFGPYIRPENFQFDPANPAELRNRAGYLIVYVPARPVQGAFTSPNSYVSAAASAYYDTRYFPAGQFQHNGAFGYLLGDRNSDGAIDSGEEPNTTAPFILWMPGPDGLFGVKTLSTTAASGCDDVVSFK